jgi:HEAT repeat protein
LIEAAINDLDKKTEWSVLMMAGLALSSLAGSPLIKPAIRPLGNTLVTHEDFDVRWRMAQVLGKIRDQESVSYLVEALSDSSFYPRDEAAWALARLGDIAVKAILARVNEFASDVIPFAALALGRSGVAEAEAQAVNLLFAEIESGDTTRQRHAIYFAGEIVNAKTAKRLIPTINDLLNSEDCRLQAVCCWALGCFAQRFHEAIAWKTVELISRDHTDLLTRFEAVVALGKLTLVQPASSMVEMLLNCLSDREDRIRYAAMQSIRIMTEKHGQIYRAERLSSWKDDDFGVMYEAALIENLGKKNRR